MSTADAILEVLREPYRLAADARAMPLGRGHINQTLLLISGQRKVVAQRINRAVFPEPAVLVANARRIEAHLLACGDYGLKVPRHLPCHRGHFLHGPDRDVRVIEYVDDSVSLEAAPNTVQAEAVARAFGGFSRALSNLEPGDLGTVIPDFHNLDYRLRQFADALENDRAGRARLCAQDIRFCQAQGQLADDWRRAVATLPLRVCHNDAKLNNLLLHRESSEPLAVIDLDTCMSGHLFVDFGDLVRTCTSAEPEDSACLERVAASPAILAALLRGYLAGLGDMPDPAERQSLVLGARLMPFMLGLRFLIDYLDGDRYFATGHPGQNLERARNQFQLYRSVCEQAGQLQQLVNETG